tara:strand:- start:4257 stop:4505 length:249 start_codon:yes stop_codon:yes gene_type:complete
MNKQKQNELLIDLLIDYAVQQKKLHIHNHKHCLNVAVESIPREHLLSVSEAFQAELKARCKDEPKLFNLIMDSLNMDSCIKG